MSSNSIQIPNTTGEESPYQFFDNYRGVEITYNGKVYYAMAYDAEKQKSVELCNESLLHVMNWINSYMANSYYTVIKDLLQSFGLNPDDFRLHDSESIQEAIKTKIAKEFINTIDNL